MDGSGGGRWGFTPWEDSAFGWNHNFPCSPPSPTRLEIRAKEEVPSGNTNRFLTHKGRRSIGELPVMNTYSYCISHHASLIHEHTCSLNQLCFCHFLPSLKVFAYREQNMDESLHRGNPLAQHFTFLLFCQTSFKFVLTTVDKVKSQGKVLECDWVNSCTTWWKYLLNADKQEKFLQTQPNVEHIENDVLAYTSARMPTLFSSSTILTVVWRALPAAKYLWDYCSAAWNTPGQKTYPHSG